MTQDHEIEAKFALTDGALGALQSIERIGRFVVTERETIEQDDLYFDTSDHALASAKATLRVRTTAQGARMTFKGPRQPVDNPANAHIAIRQEIEVHLVSAYSSRINTAQALPDDPNLAPLTRARALAGGGDFLPAARIRNHRIVLHLRATDDAALELALDNCVGTRLADQRTVSFIEAELELKAGNRQALAEAADDLRVAVPDVIPSQATKLGRVMG